MESLNNEPYVVYMNIFIQCAVCIHLYRFFIVCSLHFKALILMFCISLALECFSTLN